MSEPAAEPPTPESPPIPTAEPVPSVMDALLDELAATAPADRRDALLVFAKMFLRRLSDEDLESFGPPQLLGRVRSAFAFVDGRGNHPASVRVFVPTLEADGYLVTGTVIETSTDDSPFLVDSVTEELNARDLQARLLLHPMIGTRRAEDGLIAQVLAGRDASHRESVIHIELERRLNERDRADLEGRLRAILHDVRLVIRDFEPMEERVRHMGELARQASVAYSPQEVGETADFIDWLLQLNFVFLGYREYRLAEGPDGRTIQAVPGSGLGILSDVSTSSFADATRLDTLDPEVRRRIEEGELLVITKTKAYATVHRRARMDYVGVRVVSPEGVIVGEARLVGLFTSKAYMEPAAKTPLLHHKLELIITAEDLIPGSHDYKEVVELFESFPRDELFQATAEELRRLVVGLLQLEKHGGIRVLVRKDLYGRQVSIVVALPREKFSGSLRRRLQEMFMERFHGTSVDYHLSLGETESARIFFTVHVEPGTQIPEIPYEALEAEVEQLARTWEDDLLDHLVEVFGPERGPVLAAEYGPRFPDYYKVVETDWEQVGVDVTMLERLRTAVDGFVIGISNEATGERLTRVKLYKTGGKVDLSAFMPLLESLGLRAVEEVPIAVQGEGKVYIHDFGVLDARGAVLNLEAESDLVREALTAMWRGETEVDSLNRLVIFSGLSWHQVQILRAYRKYRMRVSTRFTEEYRNDALAENPHYRGSLVELFEAKFDPIREHDARGDRGMPAAAQGWPAERVLARPGHDHPFARSARSSRPCERTPTSRTARRCRSSSVRRDVPEMPKPFPLFEIFVYSPQMEAIHLRGGMVARGGIRWSDRKEDYRTEVLGLMKAQKVKNAVIVPDGSKGGFILKRVGDAATSSRRRSSTQYVTFMRGLLDITDNLVDGRVDHPDGVRVLDGEDPYLVVAADKGTATFSDTANGVAEEYGYWLGDAFASGGSAGYDHKALGITARGAWESVRRHFREIGVDVLRHTFTVRRDRRHVRRRVRQRDALHQPGAAGRGVRPPQRLHRPRSRSRRRRSPSASGCSCCRGRRGTTTTAPCCRPAASCSTARRSRVTPSKEARVALGLPDDAPDEMTPDQLIARILQAPVDLLWNGGIGTYVKASVETHGDVGRPHERPRARERERRAREGRRRGRQPRLHAARADRVRASGRAYQHRLHRQLGGRRHLRPRGQLEDPARVGDPARRAHAGRAQRAAAGLRARRGAARPVRQLPAGADPVAGRRGLRAADRGLRGADAAARGRWRARARRGVPAHDRRHGGAPRRRPRDDAPGARRAARLREAAGVRRAPRERPARLGVPGGRPRPVLPAADRRAVRPPDRRPSAEAPDHRDDGVQRRRELAGDHVRLADGDRDGRVAVRGGACVPDRARCHGRDRSVERRRSPRRAGRPRAAVRADERRRLAGRDDGALVPRASSGAAACCRRSGRPESRSRRCRRRSVRSAPTRGERSTSRRRSA